jgi:VWFA-related protein
MIATTFTFRLTSALTCLALLDGRAAGQTATFTSRAEAVQVDVLVTDRGRPVMGLGASDFEVLDDGVPQQVELVSLEQLPLKVVLVFDMSGSVSGERLDHLQAAAGTLLTGLKPADRAALLTFSHVVTQRSALTRELHQVRTALSVEGTQGGTALVDGTYAGMLVGEADAGRALLIVFSDGLDTSSWLPAQAVLDTTKRSDVVVYAVAVGISRQSTFLRELTTLTGGNLLEVEGTRNIGPTFLRILTEFRNRYVVSYSPRGVERAGWHRLDVRVKGRSGTVKARPGDLVGPDDAR